ncbi:uncharacterized protein LOC131163061 [Malania oleifera]|uniref:uncharacterized protein LOC131163061 n=1 Tax=Malania oleifera TaxID=397392 RepID=UPI0025AE6E48|nr:uncharacterized protein LOC131163061 [Malania oleifera]
MRKRRWLEHIKDYDRTISYHPGKANVVTDALSQKSMGAALSVVTIQHPIQMDLERFGMELVEDDHKGEQFGISDDSDDGALRFHTILCVPVDAEIKKIVLEEAHRSLYTVHAGSIKMYWDLQESFWWSGMKRAMTKFVKQCLTC